MPISTNLIINKSIDLLELIDVLKSNKDYKNLNIDIPSDTIRIFFDYKLENRILHFKNHTKLKNYNYCGEGEIKKIKDGDHFTILNFCNWGHSTEIILFIADHFKKDHDVWFQESDCKDKFKLIK